MLFRSDIEKAVKEKGLKDVKEVSAYLKAGVFCGACLDDIKAIVDSLK